MALQPCRECGRDVSTEAPACPHCGVPGPVPPEPEAKSRKLECPECGADLTDVVQARGRASCPNCGAQLVITAIPGREGGASGQNSEVSRPAVWRTKAPAPDGFVLPLDPPRDPTSMALLSLLIPGLGQIVIGQVKKGFAMLGGSVVLAALSGLVLMPIVWLVVSVEAYQVARKLARGEPVGEWEFFPR